VETITTTSHSHEQLMERAAIDYVQRWRQTVLGSFWAIITGNKENYRQYQKEYLALFSTPSTEEIREAIAAVPENMRWWDAVSRDANELESKIECQLCGEGFRGSSVKTCPNCKVVLHAHCFETYVGGYETPLCECCRHRCSNWETQAPTDNLYNLLTLPDIDLID
jgi:hypothetical protein